MNNLKFIYVVFAFVFFAGCGAPVPRVNYEKQAAAAGVGRGTCEDPFELAAGQEVESSTEGLAHALQGPCIQGKAPEAVYRVEIDEPGTLTAEVEATFDSGLYLLDACDREAEVLACNDDYEMKSGRSKISVSLGPGVYFLVVDGFGTMSGEYTLKSGVTARMQPDALCAEAPLLQPDKDISGNTSAASDTFHGTCAHGSRGPDKVYRVKIEEPSRVRFFLETPDFDGVLHLHKGCPGESVEIGCNDDFGDNRSSMIMADLDQGTYILVADGFDGMDAGAYMLRMEAFSHSEAASPDDTCEGAGAIEGISKEMEQVVFVKGSTFRAGDTFQPVCVPSPGGPDVFRSFHLDFPSIVSIKTISTHFPGLVISIVKGCAGKDLACQVESLETMLPGGDYILAVDSLGADQLGDFELEMGIQSVEALKKICAGGSKLVDGKLLKGAAKGKGSFMGSCGGFGFGPENVHVLELKKKSSVRIEVNPGGFDSVIYIRRSCEAKSSEVACNDDAGSTKQSVIETALEKGTYYVFVDGCKENDFGNYTIRAVIK